MRLPEGFSLQIPLMEYVTPGGKRLEGSGVVPDVSVDEAKIADDKAVLSAAMIAFKGTEAAGGGQN
jgi:C-terminal processing protease CtpA/Prc